MSKNSKNKKTIKAKLKPLEEIKRFLKETVVSDLYRLSLQSKDNTISVRETSNPEVFVELSTGWSVPITAIDYLMYECNTIDAGKDWVKVTSSIPSKPEFLTSDEIDLLCTTSNLEKVQKPSKELHSNARLALGSLVSQVDSNSEIKLVSRADIIKALSYDFVEPVSETLEATLDEDPSLTIPELNKEPTGDVEGTYGPNIAMYEDALKEYTESLQVPEVLPFKMSKTMFNKTAVQYHRTHYVKLVMKNENLSFRFFYESEDNKHQEGRWFLKDHAKKTSIEVTKDFIEKHFDDIVGAFEIIGRLIPKKGYRKIIKNIHTGELTEVKE